MSLATLLPEQLAQGDAFEKVANKSIVAVDVQEVEAQNNEGPRRLPSGLPASPSLLHRSLRERPLLVKSAQGHFINLDDGRTILDACGGAAVSVLGHGNSEVTAAILQQLNSVAYIHTIAYTTESAEKLAEFLVGSRPGGLCKAWFVGSGSEAMEGAMKLARQYFVERGETQRCHFIARRQGYHGNTWGSMSISNNKSRRTPYLDMLLPNVSHVSPCYSYRFQGAKESEDQYARRLGNELEAEFQRIGPDKVIAFVAETVGGATSGCISPCRGYFEAVQAVCHKYGALLILDEIMCGSGRTGTFFAWEQENVVPDIMAIGKGLGGGYAPIAGICVHERVIDGLSQGTGAFNHGHTFQAHAVSCAAALAVQRIIRRDGLVERCAAMGSLLNQQLQEALREEQHVGDIRGRGLFWAVEFVKDQVSKTPFDPALQVGVKIQQRAFELGVAVYPGAGTIDGDSGDHVLIAPPYTITEPELKFIASTLRDACRDVFESLSK